MELQKFNPNRVITDNLKKIAVLVHELNLRKPSKVATYELEKRARELSSYSSTSIEGNPLPLTDVKNLIKNRPENLRDTEKEVLNYNDTLIWLNQRIKQNDSKFSIKLLQDIHKKSMKDLLPQFHLGHFRKEPVFVNDPVKRKTVYWPPDHQDVQALMSQLVDFTRNNLENYDPVILAGLFHRAFILIHPYIDGNGRTVRLATTFLLARLGINTFSLFSFENYYNQNVTKYFKHVGEHGNYYDLKDQLDNTRWLEYFSGGIVDELLRVQKALEEAEESPQTRLKKHHLAILKYIEKNGFITDADYSKITNRAKATRSLDFKYLMEHGQIKRLGKGKATHYKKKM
jgi:Fic family protein